MDAIFQSMLHRPFNGDLESKNPQPRPMFF